VRFVLDASCFPFGFCAKITKDVGTKLGVYHKTKNSHTTILWIQNGILHMKRLIVFYYRDNSYFGI